MVPIEDFLTSKVREIDGMIKAMLSISGRVNPAVVYGLKGEEHGVPLDLRPFGDPEFREKHRDCVEEASTFSGMPVAALVVGAAMAQVMPSAWPAIVAHRLRQVSPDWFVLLALAFSIEGSTAMNLYPDGKGGIPNLFVAGANRIRNFAIVTQICPTRHGTRFGESFTRDTITDRGGIGGPFVGVYLPGGN